MRDPSSRGSVSEVARVFLRLGTTAFGGPVAHLAMMEEELVRRRGWVTHQEFLDLLGATNLIPGPNSTEMAIHLGHRRAGWPGLLTAGACFILPAAVIVTVLAWVYERTHGLPATRAVFYGVKPVVIALVAQALWRLLPVAARTPWLGGIAALAAVASALGADELVVLLGAGAAAASWQAIRSRRAAVAALAGLGPAGVASSSAAFSLAGLFLVFLKIGAVLYGSGYVLLAFLRTDLVVQRHWLTESQLLDAIAVGQVTPGPVFTTATFIGYHLAGLSGAALATLGIFLPSFAFVAVSGPLVPRVRRSATAGAILDAVNAASLALMAVVTWRLARVALVDPVTIVLGVASLLVLLRTRIHSMWLVLAGAAIGVAGQALR
jgi:chromate transporter